ncbi:hypothetical protein HLRTI_001533 [Halorhabdus tiamatea SARL4B]|uniref:Uncharacterized protein n=1 Tax=Halorhabdus tiamatea SARL4B TaxID=1033806 RepID=U2FDR7_9EURY|nr:hypothetical protein [Halorhabdus tiamatea]ERJ06454.1 hypothetical protein HLRTI_001533 [Halorhabdus tiamatea SARL4B]
MASILSGVGLDDYLHDREEVYHRTETYNAAVSGEYMDSVDLACTSHRVVFTTGSRVVDIDLHSIDAIEYEPPTIPLDYLVGALVTFVAAYAYSTTEIFPDLLPDLVDVGLSALLWVAGPALIVGALLTYGPTLLLRTSSNTYTFKRGDLEEVPHAIRGAQQ